MIWANKTQDKINEHINPVLLEFYQKKNLRSLTASESKELESVKTKLFFLTEPNTKITESLVISNLDLINSNASNIMYAEYCNWLKVLASQLDGELSVEDLKQAKASFYLMVYNNLN
jgi:hypothetical protein